MSADLQTYQTMKVMSSSETSNTEEPYISMNDEAEVERLKGLVGPAYGDTLLDEESREFQETLGELGIFGQQEEIR